VCEESAGSIAFTISLSPFLTQQRHVIYNGLTTGDLDKNQSAASWPCIDPLYCSIDKDRHISTTIDIYLSHTCSPSSLSFNIVVERARFINIDQYLLTSQLCPDLAESSRIYQIMLSYSMHTCSKIYQNLLDSRTPLSAARQNLPKSTRI